MFLLGFIQINLGGGGVSDGLKKRVDALGVWGSLLLGVVFALAFCPTSAALFFGNVMASIGAGSTFAMPLLYGVGTALPVIVFALLIAVGSKKLGSAFNAVGKVEWWARNVTGTVMLLIGVYMTVRYVFLA
jgi:cytochrome c biogenesis protein CcdA